MNLSLNYRRDLHSIADLERGFPSSQASLTFPQTRRRLRGAVVKAPEPPVPRQDRRSVVAIEVTAVELVEERPHVESRFAVDQQVGVTGVTGDGGEYRVIHQEEHVHKDVMPPPDGSR